MLSTPKFCASSHTRLGKKGHYPVGCTPSPGLCRDALLLLLTLLNNLPGSTITLQANLNLGAESQNDELIFYSFFRTSSLLIYKIPMEDALPLSQSFSKLEAGKRKQSIKYEDCFQIAHMDLFFKDAFSIPPQLNRISGLRSTACHCTLCNRYVDVEVTG